MDKENVVLSNYLLEILFPGTLPTPIDLFNVFQRLQTKVSDLASNFWILASSQYNPLDSYWYVFKMFFYPLILYGRSLGSA